MSPSNPLDQLSEAEYEERIEVSRLRREVYEQPDPAASEVLLKELQKAERGLSTAEKARANAQAKDPKGGGVILDTNKTNGLLGPKTTGLDAQVYLRMAQVPTAISHLLNPDQHPLVSCRVRNAGNAIRRLRVSTFLDGYSARAVDTIELDPLGVHEFNQLPTFFPDRVRAVTELTRATLDVLVEDLDGKVELHKSYPIWLLARTTAPLAVRDPKTGQWQDLTPYLGAYVTPNAPDMMKFLRVVAQRHPKGRLVGYQISETEVEPQVRAIYEALKFEAKIAYVNSVIAFSPEEGSANQRIRLPRESLEDKEANCIDGTVLFASLLEGISMSPAIVIVPGHAFVAWETWKKSGKWKYLETTMIQSHNFEEALKSAHTTAESYQEEAKSLGDPSRFRLWPLRTLRSDSRYRITPME